MILDDISKAEEARRRIVNMRSSRDAIVGCGTIEVVGLKSVTDATNFVIRLHTVSGHSAEANAKTDGYYAVRKLVEKFFNHQIRHHLLELRALGVELDPSETPELAE